MGKVKHGGGKTYPAAGSLLLILIAPAARLGSLAEHDEAPPMIVELAEQRLRARAEGDWEESDRLRSEIGKHGWMVRDTPDGYLLLHP